MNFVVVDKIRLIH